MVTELIREFILRVSADFEEYANSNDGLCALKSLNFEGGNLPDYTDEHIQQLYLLRYTYAYAYEYKHIYEVIVYYKGLPSNIKVLSVGCGNMVDYWSLVEALHKYGKEDTVIDYTGLDAIDWRYKMKKRDCDSQNFIRCNAAEWLSAQWVLDEDIYIFPKSISEFTRDEFEAICECFKNKPILKDKFHVLISVRADSGSMAMDRSRSNRIISAIQANGFEPEENGGECWYLVEGGKLIRELDPNFSYPGTTIDFLKTLNELCATRDEDSDECNASNCGITKYPILRGTYVNYMIITFNRVTK